MNARACRRRSLGQNFLVDDRVVDRLLQPFTDPAVPILELGAGSGAVTHGLVARGRRVTAVEADPEWARALRRRFDDLVDVVEGDMLAVRFPAGRHDVVSSVPFGITTDLLRRLFAEPGWQVASLLLQWEVARKRAAGTLLTASWWPWFDLELIARVPARAFRPVPAVDGGILVIRRRATPLVAQRATYQRFVEEVFTGRSRGLGAIIRLSALDARGWAALYRACGGA
jgi:23S rRNA (adenine-N6)-dimethyltransferase